MRALPHSVSWILHQATTDPQLCQRILDTFGEVWVSLLWGHCFFLLGPCLHKVLSVPSKSLFPQSCVSSSSSMGGVNGDLLQEGLCHTQVCCTQSPCPCGRPLLTCTSTGDAQTLEGRSGLVSVEYPGANKVLSEPSKCLWWVWGLILNVISPLLLSCWVFSFALGQGYIFLGGIQHSPDNGCSAMSCNFGVLAGEDELTSFYSAILNVHLVKAMVLSVVMYGYESWTIKKVEHWRIDAFELLSWRRLLRVSWTARRSNTVLVTKHGATLGASWSPWSKESNSGTGCRNQLVPGDAMSVSFQFQVWLITNGPDLYTLQTFQVLCKQDQKKKNEFLSSVLVGNCSSWHSLDSTNIFF